LKTPRYRKLNKSPGTPDIRTLTTITLTRKTPQGIPLEKLLDQPLKDLFEGDSNLRFESDRTNYRFDP